MDKYCERCYARDAKPCMECSTCNPGHHNFRSAPTLPPTNADHIRSMSDEELAEWLDGLRGCGTCNRYHNKQYPINETLDWLRQPAGEEHDG